MLLSIKPATSEKKEIPHQLENTEIMPDNSEELQDEPYQEAADSIEEDKRQGEELKKLQEDQAQNGEESEEESNDEEELDLTKSQKGRVLFSNHIPKCPSPMAVASSPSFDYPQPGTGSFKIAFNM